MFSLKANIINQEQQRIAKEIQQIQANQGLS